MEMTEKELVAIAEHFYSELVDRQHLLPLLSRLLERAKIKRPWQEVPPESKIALFRVLSCTLPGSTGGVWDDSALAAVAGPSRETDAGDDDEVDSDEVEELATAPETTESAAESPQGEEPATAARPKRKSRNTA